MRKLLACVAAALLSVACDSDTSNPNDPSQVNIAFTVTDIVVGTGEQAASGRRVETNYTLWLYNAMGPESKGTHIQTNTFQFLLGARQTIPGYEQAVLGMRVGGQRRAYIPPQLAYGAQGSGNIPPNAALVFEIELVNVQ